MPVSLNSRARYWNMDEILSDNGSIRALKCFKMRCLDFACGTCVNPLTYWLYNMILAFKRGFVNEIYSLTNRHSIYCLTNGRWLSSSFFKWPFGLLLNSKCSECNATKLGQGSKFWSTEGFFALQLTWYDDSIRLVPWYQHSIYNLHIL